MFNILYIQHLYWSQLTLSSQLINQITNSQTHNSQIRDHRSEEVYTVSTHISSESEVQLCVKGGVRHSGLADGMRMYWLLGSWSSEWGEYIDELSEVAASAGLPQLTLIFTTPMNSYPPITLCSSWSFDSKSLIWSKPLIWSEVK